MRAICLCTLSLPVQHAQLPSTAIADIFGHHFGSVAPQVCEVFQSGGSGAWAGHGRGASRNGTGSCSCRAARCAQSMGLVASSPPDGFFLHTPTC